MKRKESGTFVNKDVQNNVAVCISFFEFYNAWLAKSINKFVISYIISFQKLSGDSSNYPHLAKMCRSPKICHRMLREYLIRIVQRE